jgi:hypothetical protein
MPVDIPAETKSPVRSAGAVLPFLLLLILGGTGYGVSRSLLDTNRGNLSPVVTEATEPPCTDPCADTEPAVRRVPVPEEVRGLYWTAHTAGTERAAELLAYMEETGLNAVVIDLKMDDGAIAFMPRDEALRPYALPVPVIGDLEAVLGSLADRGIYRIARLAVMRDGVFAEAHPDITLHTRTGSLWRDKIGSKWMDPASPEVRDYAIALAREAYERGFDEIQFDYVRFPSDGEVGAIVYPESGMTTSTMWEIMTTFFSAVGAAGDEAGFPVSFDFFGMPFMSMSDFNIGQRLGDVYRHADYISPMTYPSHYPPNFQGLANPALHPFDVIKTSLDSGATILSNIYGVPEEEARKKFRPWIQDFDIGAVYTADMIEEEIRAVRAAGSSGFLIWNARNVYEKADYVSSTRK